MSSKPIKILGVYRNPKFSNNAIEADRKILEESAELLCKKFSPDEIDCSFFEEEEVLGRPIPRADLILAMAQSEEALDALAMWSREVMVINSPASVRSCYRKTMSDLLKELSVGYVPFQTVSTSRPQELNWPGTSACWLKRSDFHAISDDDVVLADNPHEAHQLLARFQARGIPSVIAQRHIHGDIYKFYGVGDRFFRAIRVRQQLTANLAPPMEILQRNAQRAAQGLSVLVYGGDAILDSEGNWHLIDLNDWPSFRICRPEAAVAIAEECYARIPSEKRAARPTLSS